MKRYFVTGLLVLLPIAGTFFVLRALLRGMERIFGELLKTYFSAHYYPGLGIAVLIALVLLVGLATTNFVGRWFVNLYERVLSQLPIVRNVYAAIKSVVETVSMQGSDNFRGVVLVEFPRPGMFLLAFVVNDTSGEVARNVDGPMINLFVPTSPNPTSGYLVFVPKDDVKYLDISVEEAMKTIMSGGIYMGTSEADQSASPEAISEGGKS